MMQLALDSVGATGCYCVMAHDAQIFCLADVADVRAGHPFRGAIDPVPGGSVHVIQIRDLDISGLKDASELLRTEIQSRKAPDWVMPGDVAFIARGNSPFAASLDSPPQRSVCSPHLFLIRVRESARLLPAFLAWQLNQLPAQRYFRQSAEGSLQLSIRRGVLEETTIQIPPLERQQVIVQLDRTARAERALLETLIKNREMELALVAERLLAPASEAA